MTERDLTRYVADLAKLSRWRRYHTWLSEHSPARTRFSFARPGSSSPSSSPSAPDPSSWQGAAAERPRPSADQPRLKCRGSLELGSEHPRFRPVVAVVGCEELADKVLEIPGVSVPARIQVGDDPRPCSCPVGAPELGTTCVGGHEVRSARDSGEVRPVDAVDLAAGLCQRALWPSVQVAERHRAGPRACRPPRLVPGALVPGFPALRPAAFEPTQVADDWRS
jgi:hypothetical protein